MFPLVLDLRRVPVLLVGSGEVLEKRHRQLLEFEAKQVTVMSVVPTQADIEKHAVVMIAGWSREQSEPIVAMCRAINKLVNAEDITDLCDFYFTSHIRRGHLVIAVSTSGTSPTLAKKVRDMIASTFGPEWTERTHLLAQMRTSLKAAGAGMKEIIEKTEKLLAEKGWLQ